MQWTVLWIGAGGFIGAVLRYAVSGWVQALSRSVSFPYGTLAVNLLGCLVIGLLSQWGEAHDLFTPEARAFVFLGFLGAFTTFSTFGNETLNLARDGQWNLMLLNIGAQVLLGLFCVWAGRALALWVWR